MNRLTIGNIGTVTRVARGGVLTLAVVLLFAAAAFTGCTKGGPTGPSEDDCASLKGGDPLGRWSDRKSPPWIMEYFPDGSYTEGAYGTRRGTYRVEGNILRYGDGNWQYFEIVGDVQTHCANGRRAYFYRL